MKGGLGSGASGRHLEQAHGSYVCKCTEDLQLLKMKPPEGDPAHPLGTSPERQAAPPGLPTRPCLCLCTMPLCGRPELSARAWARSSSCFLPLGPTHSLGSASMTVPLQAWHAWESTGCHGRALSIARFPSDCRGPLSPASPLPSSQAFDCAVSSSWNASPTPSQPILPCVGLGAGEAFGVSQMWFNVCSWAGRLCGCGEMTSL